MPLSADLLYYTSPAGYKMPALAIIPGPYSARAIPTDGPFWHMYGYWWLALLDTAKNLRLYQAVNPSTGAPIRVGASDAELAGADWAERATLANAYFNAGGINGFSASFTPRGSIAICLYDDSASVGEISKQDESSSQLYSYAWLDGKDIHLVGAYAWRKSAAGADLVVVGLDANRTSLLSFPLQDSFVGHIYGNDWPQAVYGGIPSYPVVPPSEYYSAFLQPDSQWSEAIQYATAMTILGVRYSHLGAYLLIAPYSWDGKMDAVSVIPMETQFADDDTYWLGTTIWDAYGVYIGIAEN